ncbi:MAG: outer membrane beta-barrel protein [Flavobacteriales bacterium]|nr:outer membrane beta-barrel protein [Flavobacteriales bacterium]HPQ57641.1 outer membrane beta-barrel protein [Flavobacteriales bacterium]
MRPRVILSALALAPVLLMAQLQINPQLGLTFQNLTEEPQGTTYRANTGWMAGIDFRIGSAFYLQPGLFFGQNATTVATVVGDTSVTTEIEDDLVRNLLKGRVMVGYKLINAEGFKLRVAVGPSYDFLLSVQSRDDVFDVEKANFNDGVWNLEAGLGLDLAMFTIEPGVAFGLSNVYSDDPAVSDINSKYFTWYLTMGLVFGEGR